MYFCMDLRVHWLLWCLNDYPDFKRSYIIDLDYLRHNYIFYRLRGRKRLYDCFIVVRTSKRCFRVMYYNSRTLDIQYFSCYRSENVVRRMWYLYKQDCLDTS